MSYNSDSYIMKWSVLKEGRATSDCDNAVKGSNEVIDNPVVKRATPVAIDQSVYRGIGSRSKDWRRIGDVPSEDPPIAHLRKDANCGGKAELVSDLFSLYGMNEVQY